MKFPAELKYTEDHEWIRIEGSTAYIGITDYAQSELGEIVYVEVDTLEEKLDQGEAFGTVEAVKTTSELYMPVAGTILEFNSKLSDEGDDQPELINEDPYGDGWIVKIEVADTEELEKLMDATAYEASVSA